MGELVFEVLRVVSSPYAVSLKVRIIIPSPNAVAIG